MHSHYGNRRVLVNVFQYGKSIKNCAKATKLDEAKASDAFSFQHSSAGGYGYDKFTAAISGLLIDGHRITDHCRGRQKLPKGAVVFPKDFKPRKGYRLANYAYGERAKNLGLPEGTEGWGDCYKESGLAYLKELGYNVVQVL